MSTSESGRDRTIVIGDIHGRYYALKQLFDKICPTNNDKFIFLGDYVDRGFNSAKTINFLIDLDNKYNCIFMRGNHDQWLLDFIKDPTTPMSRAYLIDHGRETINSYARSNMDYKIHLEFLENTKHYYTNNGIAYIHAGFISEKGLGYENDMHDYFWDTTLWDYAVEDKLDKRLENYKEIYIGHTPTIIYDLNEQVPEFNYCTDTKYSYNKINYPMNRKNIWNIDTGAGFLIGKLSGIDIDTKQVYQTDIISKI